MAALPEGPLGGLRLPAGCPLGTVSPVVFMESRRLTLLVLAEKFAVCRFDKGAAVPPWVWAGSFSSVTQTMDEISIVCLQQQVPQELNVSRDWRCLKVAGPLDFSMIGVLSSLAMPLAEAGVSILAISTYETDYLLVKQDDLEKAIKSLSDSGHSIHRGAVLS
jgi:hypothetical protein